MKSAQHIAASGKKQGQWVDCIAEPGQCRLNGGLHVEESTLKEVQAWAGRRAWVDLTLKDYEDYLQSQIRGTLEQDRRPMETLEQKLERLGKDRVTVPVEERKQQPGTRLDKAFAEAEANKNGMSEKEYYATMWQDYPEILALPLADQKRIREALDVKFQMGGTNTLKAKTLKEWVETGQVNDAVKLRRRMLSSYGKKPEPVKVKPRNSSGGIKPVSMEEFSARLKKINEALNNVPRASTNQTQPAVRVPQNRVPDFVPLNNDSYATQLVLKHLREHKIVGQGAFGSKTKTDKLVEYMVHNQIVFRGTISNYSFEQKPAATYAGVLGNEIRHAYSNIDHMVKSGEISFKKLKSEIENHVENTNKAQTMQKSIHDTFVETSKKELIKTIVRKGHDDNSGLIDRVTSATKASEIYALIQNVDDLKTVDEFSKAGL